jgi:hypothetical protein
MKRMAFSVTDVICFFACRNRSMVFSAAKIAASPAFANLFTHGGNFPASSFSANSSQKWLQLRERRS